MNDLVKQDWYNTLIEECQAIIGETVFIARDTVIKGKWMLGERVLQEKRIEEKDIPTVGKDIGISKTELYNCIQFYKKFPDLDKFLSGVPEQKNISWHKIVHLYLPEGKTGEEIEYENCPTCGKKWKRK